MQGFTANVNVWGGESAIWLFICQVLGVVGGPNRPGAGSWPGTRGMADQPNATSGIHSGLYDERLQENANLSHICICTFLPICWHVSIKRIF